MQESTEELLYRGWGGALVSAGAALVILVFIAGLGGVRLGLWWILFALCGAGGMGFVIQRAVVAGAAKAAGAIVNPSGKSTPYVRTYSHIQAMEVRMELEAAERAWMEEVTLDPENPNLILRVAEFYLRVKRDRPAARPYFERLLALPTTNADLRGYASRKVEELRGGEAPA